VEETVVATVADAFITAIASTISPAWIVAGAGILTSLLSFHAVLGTPIGRWIVDLPFALGGFAAGNLAGYLADWPTPRIGDVHPIEGALGAWFVLGAIAILGAIAPAVPARLLRRGRIW
jgi:hypothetical protein